MKKFYIFLLIAGGVAVYYGYLYWHSLIWACEHFLGCCTLPKNGDSYALSGCGGAGFVELITGFNLALIGIRELRERLRFIEGISRSFSDSRSATILDSGQKQKVGVMYERLTERWKAFNIIVWWISYAGAVLMTLMGAWMLYRNSYCQHSWFLLAPWGLYFAWMTLCLLGLILISKIVTFVTNVVNPDSPAGDIASLEKQSKRERHSENAPD